MTKRVENKLQEVQRLMDGFTDITSMTKELREMCKNCEEYSGGNHDYRECRDKWCYKFWLAYRYLEWSSSWE